MAELKCNSGLLNNWKIRIRILRHEYQTTYEGAFAEVFAIVRITTEIPRALNKKATRQDTEEKLAWPN